MSDILILGKNNVTLHDIISADAQQAAYKEIMSAIPAQLNPVFDLLLESAITSAQSQFTAQTIMCTMDGEFLRSADADAIEAEVDHNDSVAFDLEDINNLTELTLDTDDLDAEYVDEDDLDDEGVPRPD